MLGRLGDKRESPKPNTRLVASSFAQRRFDRRSEWAVRFLDAAGPTGEVDVLLRTVRAFERAEPEVLRPHP